MHGDRVSASTGLLNPSALSPTPVPSIRRWTRADRARRTLIRQKTVAP
jgi:hypothetical protein